ncbi:MAG: hypothetical protein AAF621_01905 [Pseudomonadota bacterium]
MRHLTSCCISLYENSQKINARILRNRAQGTPAHTDEGPHVERGVVQEFPFGGGYTAEEWGQTAPQGQDHPVRQPSMAYKGGQYGYGAYQDTSYGTLPPIPYFIGPSELGLSRALQQESAYHGGEPPHSQARAPGSEEGYYRHLPPQEGGAQPAESILVDYGTLPHQAGGVETAERGTKVSERVDDAMNLLSLVKGQPRVLPHARSSEPPSLTQNDLAAEVRDLRSEYEALSTSYRDLSNKHAALSKSHGELRRKVAHLTRVHEALSADYNELGAVVSEMGKQARASTRPARGSTEEVRDTPRRAGASKRPASGLTQERRSKRSKV